MCVWTVGSMIRGDLFILENCCYLIMCMYRYFWRAELELTGVVSCQNGSWDPGSSPRAVCVLLCLAASQALFCLHWFIYGASGACAHTCTHMYIHVATQISVSCLLPLPFTLFVLKSLCVWVSCLHACQSSVCAWHLRMPKQGSEYLVQELQTSVSSCVGFRTCTQVLCKSGKNSMCS